jgi:predicted glycosyltransferase
VEYTGFVTDAVGPAPRPSSDSYAVLSSGGGAGSLAFLLASIEAFRRLRAAGESGAARLVVFAGPFLEPAEVEALASAVRDGPFELQAFTPDFPRWLAGSVFSISRAGYNTVAALLRSRVRAVLAPDPAMSDQGPRATRLATLGLVTVVEGRGPAAAAIAAAVSRALAGPRPRHALDLDGIAFTRAWVERLAARDGTAWGSTDTSASRSTRA